MASSLYDLSVMCFLQTLGGVAGYLDKGLTHCRDNNIDPDEIVESRLFSDMLPFRYQIQAVAASFGRCDRRREGRAVFTGGKMPPLDYAGLQKLVTDAREALAALTPADVNALEGRDVLSRFATSSCRSSPRGFCSPSRCRIFRSTRRRRTTFCVLRACRSESATIWASCG